jgi:hypothetical protein
LIASGLFEVTSMRLLLFAFVCVSLLAGCGGDDTAGPGENLPPYFVDRPAAVAPGALLKSVVTGDQIGFTARAVDPDVEPVSYLWELVDEDGAPVNDGSAGTVLDAQNSSATWVVAEFEGSVSMRCTVTDGKESHSEQARSYSAGFPLRAQVIESDLTLDAANSPYVILEGLTVDTGATLTLEAGVELQVRLARGGTTWSKFPIAVFGTLVTRGVTQNPVVIAGGYTEDPVAGGGTEQFVGVDVRTGGVAVLEYAWIQDAEAGLRIRSLEPSKVEGCIFSNCGIGVQVEAGAGTTLTSILFRENRTGLQLNSASVELDGCFFQSSSSYGINVDASTGPAGVMVTGSEFQGNLQSHVRLASLSGQSITATINGSNFLEQTNGAPVINLFSNCFVYSLDLRGNFWGSEVDPSDIIRMFDDFRHCGHIDDWVDSDCGGDPDACDWSNTAW